MKALLAIIRNILQLETKMRIVGNLDLHYVYYDVEDLMKITTSKEVLRIAMRRASIVGNQGKLYCNKFILTTLKMIVEKYVKLSVRLDLFVYQ